MSNMKVNCAQLNNGSSFMPLLGLGCWQSPPGEVATAVEVALDNGYRHIDTAYNYQNEEAVGKGIQNWLKKDPKNKREDIFVVTKLPMIGMRVEDVKRFMNLSLKKLNLSYVDLYLIHLPIGFNNRGDDKLFTMTDKGMLDIDASTDLIAIWKAMEKLVDEGLAKSIGISNFNIRQMTKIMAIAKIPPSVNQVELHVEFQQRELVEYCRKAKIVVTAYAPLGSPGKPATYISPGIKLPNLLNNPVVKLVADNHKVTTAQILIKFIIQMGIVVIPKSVTPDRIKTNGDVFNFTLSETEMEALKLLDKGEDGRCNTIKIFPGICDHPEFPF